MTEFLNDLNDNLKSVPVWGWIVLALLLLGGLTAFLMLRKKSGTSFWTGRTMSVGAMCMALASVLSLIQLPLPWLKWAAPSPLPACCRC